jgi:hypothetical protein
MMAPIFEHSAIASLVIRPFREMQPSITLRTSFKYFAAGVPLREPYLLDYACTAQRLARVRRLVLHSFIRFLARKAARSR